MSRYLSRLLLNPRSRQVWSELAHPYEMHRTLMRAFPEATEGTQRKAREEFGVLFRAEVDDPRRVVKVYVQSHIEPDWSFLEGLKDYLPAAGEMPQYECKDITAASRRIQQGQVLSFRLRANPTKRVAKEDDRLRGKRVELNREEEQIAWLVRKGQWREKALPGGFSLVMREVEDAEGEGRPVPAVTVCTEGKHKGRKADDALGHGTTHLAVVFDGLLRVTDRDAFLETLLHGIGSAKAFGFGLLSVAPIRG